MTFSIIDYIGIFDNGVAILLSLNIKNDIYEFIYWFNVNGDCKIISGKDFLELIDKESIYDFEHLDSLLDKIEEAIPDRAFILKEFGLI